MAGERYDAIVIGAGQSGGPLASALARAGRKTAIVERAFIGGTCINFGCTPTKTMVASAEDAYMVGRRADYGVHTDGAVRVDMRRVRQRKREMVESFRSGSEGRLRDTDGLDVLHGEARFTGPTTISIHTDGGEPRMLESSLVLINAGERPARPKLPGIDEVPYLDSTSIMELDEVPDHLLILGGGYIGLEFGQMFRRFGSSVTIVQRGPQLLAREDRDIADAVAEILREDGIEVLLDTAATRVARGEDGSIRLTVRGGDGEHTLAGSHLLAAAGRAPNTDALDLPAAGVEMDDKGYIKVDERLQTSVQGIYAMGDVKGPPAFTHISYDDYRILRTNLIEGGRASTAGRLVPYTVFIDPQLGRVGLSEREAREQGRAVRVAKMPMNYVARALEVDRARGMMKALVDAESGQILGCAILGLDGGEVMSMIEIAMMGKLHYSALAEGIFAHPTLAESLNNLFGSLDS